MTHLISVSFIALPGQAEYDRTSLQTLRSTRVVGMTTSGVARQQKMVAAMQPRVSAARGSWHSRVWFSVSGNFSGAC